MTHETTQISHHALSQGLRTEGSVASALIATSSVVAAIWFSCLPLELLLRQAMVLGLVYQGLIRRLDEKNCTRLFTRAGSFESGFPVVAALHGISRPVGRLPTNFHPTFLAEGSEAKLDAEPVLQPEDSR